MEEPKDSSTWTWEQNKAFENALAVHPEDAADRWEKIAAAVSEKTVEDIEKQYELLVEDVNEIESGRVPLPCYVASSDEGRHSHGNSCNHGGKASTSDQKRRRGRAWTEDEHRLFLLGLNKYGKGDWRSISRNFVKSRTASQVASHAQKYFIRLNSTNKDRRRSSIHDITSVGNGDLSIPQGPITGQTNHPVVVDPKSAEQSPRQPPSGSTSEGQPVGGPLFCYYGCSD